MLTPNSTLTPYCSPSQYLDFADAVRTGELVRDDGTSATPTQLLSDPVLNAALMAASGRVESAALIGGRYAPSDLSNLNGASAMNLAKIVANLAFGSLLARRGYDTQQYPGVTDALAELESIRTGAAIFAFAETEAAGNATDRMRTAIEIARANLLTNSPTARRFLPGGERYGSWGCGRDY